MNNPSNQDDLKAAKKHVQHHIMMAVGIALGTVMTLWTSQTNFGSFALNVTMTLGIAVVQAFLVAAFFMHLLSEKKLIYCFLAFTAVFFAVMMGITLWSRMPENIVHYKQYVP